MLGQSLTGRLMASDDDEDVPVDENHDEQRREEEAGVLAAEADLR